MTLYILFYLVKQALHRVKSCLKVSVYSLSSIKDLEVRHTPVSISVRGYFPS